MSVFFFPLFFFFPPSKYFYPHYVLCLLFGHVTNKPQPWICKIIFWKQTKKKYEFVEKKKTKNNNNKNKKKGRGGEGHSWNLDFTFIPVFPSRKFHSKLGISNLRTTIQRETLAYSRVMKNATRFNSDLARARTLTRFNSDR